MKDIDRIAAALRAVAASLHDQAAAADPGMKRLIERGFGAHTVADEMAAIAAAVAADIGGALEAVADQLDAYAPPDEAWRIGRALAVLELGVYDGAHHKDWAIDQAVRALTGCPPLFPEDPEDHRMGVGPEYHAWVGAHPGWHAMQEGCPP